MRKNQQETHLIVKLSSLSNVLLASPFAKALKHQKPASRIVWITQPECLYAIEANPYVDRVITWDKRHWQTLLEKKQFRQLWKEARRLQRELKSENIHTAFDLQGLFKSGFIAWLSGAKQRIGLGSREGSYWFMDKMMSSGVVYRNQFAADYRYLINQLGLNDTEWTIEIPIDDATKQSITNTLHEHIAEEEGYVVILPFSNQHKKEWSTASWQQLILRIRGRYNLKALILDDSPINFERGKELASCSGAINFAGKTSLKEAYHLLTNANFAIGVDNPLTHISQSIDIPSIMLLGATKPYLEGKNHLAKTIYLSKDCSPCGKKLACNGRFDCMKEITTDYVLLEIKTLMKQELKFVAHANSHAI